jgi:uncharacterized protein (TIGR03067 family)
MNAWATVAVAITLAAFTGDAEAIKKDKAALQGTWKVIASQQDGDRVPPDDLKDLYLIFKGDAILIREGGKTDEKFAFNVDPSKKPKEMDLTIKFGPNKEKIDRAIYEFDGDRVRICIQSNKDSPRPREFASLAGSKLWLVTLQRTKD